MSKLIIEDDDQKSAYIIYMRYGGDLIEPLAKKFIAENYKDGFNVDNYLQNI